MKRPRAPVPPSADKIRYRYKRKFLILDFQIPFAFHRSGNVGRPGESQILNILVALSEAGGRRSFIHLLPGNSGQGFSEAPSPSISYVDFLVS